MDIELSTCIIHPLFIRDSKLREEKLDEFYSKLSKLVKSPNKSHN